MSSGALYRHGNELLAFIGLEGRKHLDELSDCQLLKKGFASLNRYPAYMQCVQARRELRVNDIFVLMCLFCRFACFIDMFMGSCA